MSPVAVVNAMGVLDLSVAAILNCVLLATDRTKYLVVELMPPNTVPENMTLSPG
jgi:hypothetical protein